MGSQLQYISNFNATVIRESLRKELDIPRTPDRSPQTLLDLVRNTPGEVGPEQEIQSHSLEGVARGAFSTVVPL